MAKLISGRVKRTPQIAISSERYDFLSLEEAEPNLGDPEVGPSSTGSNPFPGGTGYILVASPTAPGGRFWALPQNVSGVGIVTYADSSGISTNVVGGFINVQDIRVSGITTLTGGEQSFSINSGTLIVDGGVGIGYSVYIGQGLEVSGIPLRRGGIGTDSFFIGREAGIRNTSGNYNLFFGRRAGYANLTGNNNNAFGAFAGYENTEGNNNNYLGNFAGFNNFSGSSNNCIGKNTGYELFDGSNNQFIGEFSGYKTSSGSFNVFIGNGAGYTNDEGSNNIAIGNSCTLNDPNGDNNLAIGIGQNYWIYGDSSYNVGLGSAQPAEKLDVNGTVKATDGFISVGNTTPIKIELVGNQLIFTAVGIGSTTLTLV